MTSKTPASAGTGEESDIGEVFFAQLPIESLELDEWNARVNPGGLRFLIENVRTTGIINPLTVRPQEGGTFGVIAGGLRLEAAKKVGMKTVPCYVRGDLTDEDAQALAISLSENLNRGSILKTELHERITELAEMTSPDQAAALLGRSVSWIGQVRRSAGLSKELREQDVDIGDVAPAKGDLMFKVLYRAYPGHPRSRSMLAKEIKNWSLPKLKDLNLYLTGHRSLRNYTVSQFLEEFEHRSMISIPHVSYIGRVAKAIRIAMAREKHPPSTLTRVAMERYLETEGYLAEVDAETETQTKEGGA